MSCPKHQLLTTTERCCLLTRSRKLEAVDGGPSASGEAEAGVAEVRAQYMGVAEKVAGMLRAQAAGT